MRHVVNTILHDQKYRNLHVNKVYKNYTRDSVNAVTIEEI